MPIIEVDAEKINILFEALNQWRSGPPSNFKNQQAVLNAYYDLAPKPEAPERAYAVFDGKFNAFVWDDKPMPGSTEYIRRDLAAIPVKGGERGWMETRSVGIWEGPFAHKKIYKSGAVSSYFIECEAPND